ncbi:MAG: hypothetical protein ACT4PJ_08880 [Gemmatimonadaceae bacterium]
MRTFSRLLAVLALAACSSGTTIIVRQPAPPPPPPRPRIEPLELALARPVRGHLLIQTSRPAYVAIFEIVPGRGVALLAPSYAHQRTWMLAGLNWVPVSWSVQSTLYYGPPSSRAVPGRWVYAIASDEPLRLPDDAFRPGYLQRVLGRSVYRSSNPYATMRAISRAFVPGVVDEAWAEDAYALPATYASDPYRTVRIYCANRSVYEVPEELADRAWCPTPGGANNTPVARSTPSRPDSVVASNGQRVRRRLPESRPPVYRVREPASPEDGPVGDGDRTNANNNAGGNGVGNGANPNDANVAKDSARARRGSGNAYGHTDDPNVRGRGIENEKQKLQTPAPLKDKEAKDKELNAVKDAPPHHATPDPRREPRVDAPAKGKPESQNEVKQEEKRAEKEARQLEQPKAEAKPEPPPRFEPKPAKPDIKPDAKPEAKPEKPDSKADSKPEVKPESKPEAEQPPAEPKGAGTAEEKDQKGKPDNKPDAKGGKPGANTQDQKDQKGKP